MINLLFEHKKCEIYLNFTWNLTHAIYPSFYFKPYQEWQYFTWIWNKGTFLDMFIGLIFYIHQHLKNGLVYLIPKMQTFLTSLIQYFVVPYYPY